ncbi:hypothetical protein TVAG_120890 [Trichomonas vaginalis G3]|uniref:Methyltransferase domain-containing protein n=1 Tax=Trichomonas vaginalis (strain ATCC PRA-98 / G3) TaxID=412133 RepID=A2D7N4_TRIV3|nr:methyltransferase domain-containing protein [Trichomonas vaginalis G3]EAY23751.1 hypothetical protein TVAG_120890 [Trichomonas vaginalis G3]KAI5490246.1 methyltransferase domain-containing protein [Trichomonas vaginalis G3]|eukprot:XP_001276999.1 hypothetical protein [Trichomonas vaginalis G3]
MSQVITVFPGGEFFSGSTDAFKERALAYFNEFYDYTNKWQKIIEVLNHNLCFVDDGAFDLSWKEDIERLSNDKAFHDKVMINHDFSDVHEPLKSFFEDSVKLTLDRSQTREPLSTKKYTQLAAKTDEDKAQEVLLFTNAVQTLFSTIYNLSSPIFEDFPPHKQALELLSHLKPFEKIPLNKDIINLVDVGAGRGYLSIFLSDILKIHTTPIEASINHSRQLLERIEMHAKSHRINIDNFSRMKLCCGFVTSHSTVPGILSSAVSYEKWASTLLNMYKDKLGSYSKYLLPNGIKEEPLTPEIFYGEQNGKPRIIQGELAVEIKDGEYDLSEKEVFLVSIHACGDLSVVSHEIALSNQKCRGSITVPCCFQHLSKGNCPLYEVNKRLNHSFFKDDDVRRKDFLNHALSTYDVTFEKRKEIIDGFVPREIVSAFVPPRQSVKKIQKLEGETEVQRIIRIANMFDLHPTEKEVEERIAFTYREVWRLEAQQIFREFFGHAFESFILIDRLQHFVELTEKNGQKFVIGMFDSMAPVSPRAFMQFTLRID